MPKSIALIGFASGLGARYPGCADGAPHLQRSGLDRYLGEHGLRAEWKTMLHPNMSDERPLEARIGELNDALEAHVRRALETGEVPFVIGGDHTSAVGTWRGTFAGLKQMPLGLLWVDAHMDAHTPESSHSGLLHGMPLAVLLGYCGENAPPCAPILRPEHICIVGARSYETEEAALLESIGVRIYHMDEIRTRGLPAVMHEAHASVRNGTFNYGITVDVDSIDPLEAPGVGTPEENGLSAKELTALLQEICAVAAPAAIELAEFNPHHDRDDATLNIAMELCLALTQHTAS
ncbi:MAG TPA: arginase [Burkholderiales bacterium]|nr:arginase [Burkholderiales bacterium]